MKGLFTKAKSELRDIVRQHDTQAGCSNTTPSPYQATDARHHQQLNEIRAPTPLDIIRYRYHHGTNLGSIYVIERWLQGSRFPDGAEGSSELAAVKASVGRIGLVATKLKFEEAWANAVTEEDIQWLADESKCTTIRLPIGYFDLPGFTKGTPFEPYVNIHMRTAYDAQPNWCVVI
jgi:hypothetical protein